MIAHRDVQRPPVGPQAHDDAPLAPQSAKGATLDDLRESVETLEDAERIAQRALGGAHPLTKEIEGFLQQARFVLRGYSLLPYGASAVVVAVIAWVWRRFLT